MSADAGGGTVVDLRSDTVTRPTTEMRRAMADAEVGDDVYGEDPTVRALEEAVAGRFGREAALLCPSGVMCNQLWLRVLSPPGTEVVVEADAHLVNYEAGAGALLAGVQFRTVPGRRGILDPAAVAAVIRPDVFPLTPTTLVCVEQTANRGGGTVYPVSTLEALRSLTRDAGVGLYCDAARVWNASVATGTDPARYGALVDGLMCCLSKGLGAPVGSLMVGDADAIGEARRWRQRYGGAMRQAGVIAAAGLVALGRVERLVEDHEHARLLAAAVRAVRPGAVDDGQVQTNMVNLAGVDAPPLVAALRGGGVLAGAMDPRTVRLVTHADVSRADVDRACDVLRRVLAAAPAEAQ